MLLKIIHIKDISAHKSFFGSWRDIYFIFRPGAAIPRYATEQTRDFHTPPARHIRTQIPGEKPVTNRPYAILARIITLNDLQAVNNRRQLFPKCNVISFSSIGSPKIFTVYRDLKHAYLLSILYSMIVAILIMQLHRSMLNIKHTNILKPKSGTLS